MTDDFHSSGYLRVGELIGSDVARSIAAHCMEISDDKRMQIVEKDGSPYSFYMNQSDLVLDELKRHPTSVQTARSLLAADVYVHQIKFNWKVSIKGSELDWHRDFAFWRDLDGMQTPNVVTLAILLDEVNHFNSPLMLIPGSHQIDGPDVSVRSHTGARQSSDITSSWTDSKIGADEATVLSPINYQTDQDEILRFLSSNDIVEFTGRPGDAIFFHGNLIHGSNKNMSPWERRMLFITYNDVDNQPKHPRSEDYISFTDNSPL